MLVFGIQPIGALAGGALGEWSGLYTALVAAAVLARRQRWLQLSAFALAVATSEALLGGLKVLYARPRPSPRLMAVSNYAFPSGHAIAAAVTAVGLVVVLLPPGPTRWGGEVRAALYAGLMALSRTYLNVHWLSDVVAGVLLGVGLAVGWPALLQELKARRAEALPADADADAEVTPRRPPAPD
jgi:undecaprenyl-diphosphatase